ncbi:MAG: hypothetical protein VKJ24_11435 [Synechococcales bacterium]|nr:hypothetical protein [Synechococcales bacterium]
MEESNAIAEFSSQVTGGQAMIVMMVGDQLLPAKTVCQNCLLADQTGQPRWAEGRLRCGNALPKPGDRAATQFECQMGFRVTHITP